MAQKKKTTKTKKLHPGGSVPGGNTLTTRAIPRNPRFEAAARKANENALKIMRRNQRIGKVTPAQEKLKRRSDRFAKKESMEIAQAAGFKNMRQMQTAIARMTPQQQEAFRKKYGQTVKEIQNRNRNDFKKQNAQLIERVGRQQRRNSEHLRRMRQQNPMMPTAGISQGRPATGRTPMPGPAPNAEAMKRMQKLMREQQARFNKMQKARMATGRAGLTRPPQDVIDQFRSGKIKTAAGEQLTLDQLMRRALRDRALGNRRKKPTPAQRRSASDARRRNNRPRTVGLPDAKYS